MCALHMIVIHLCNDFFGRSVRREEWVAGLFSQLRQFQARIFQTRDTHAPEQVSIGVDFEDVIFAVHGAPSLLSPS